MNKRDKFSKKRTNYLTLYIEILLSKWCSKTALRPSRKECLSGTKGLRNSEIRFGIGIEETEPSRTTLQIYLQTSERHFSEFQFVEHDMLHRANFTMFVLQMAQTNSDSEPIPKVSQNWWNSEPNRFWRIFFFQNSRHLSQLK